MGRLYRWSHRTGSGATARAAVEPAPRSAALRPDRDALAALARGEPTMGRLYRWFRRTGSCATARAAVEPTPRSAALRPDRDDLAALARGEPAMGRLYRQSDMNLLLSLQL